MIYNGLIGESYLSCIAEDTELSCTAVKKPANGYSILPPPPPIWGYGISVCIFNTVVADFEVTEAIFFISRPIQSVTVVHFVRRIQNTVETSC